MITRILRRRGNPDPEAGSAIVFVIGFALVLLIMAGVVVDGGLALNARQRVADDVEQAARAGALNLNLPELRSNGVVAIDQSKARDAVAEFLGNRGYTSNDGVTIQTSDKEVIVTATVQQKTAMLSLLHIDHFTIKATGAARPTVGINGGGTP
jgi:Flp pilus assembly protein TadG